MRSIKTGSKWLNALLAVVVLLLALAVALVFSHRFNS